MGLSSNARLLSLTARITSNEYEAQKIANSKMRLATQSQQASADYINALNANKLMFMTYDAQGNPINTDLTAALLYQYGDSKSQYALSNPAGQLLIRVEEKEAFEGASNLEEFLAAHGIEKTWKTEKLAQLKEEMTNYEVYKDEWENILNKYANKTYENITFNTGVKYGEAVLEHDEDNGYYEAQGGNNQDNRYIYGTYEALCAEDAWSVEKTGKYNDYVIAYNDYDNLLSKCLQINFKTDVNGVKKDDSGKTKEAWEDEISALYDNQNDLYAEYKPYVTFDSWLEVQAKAENKEAFDNYQKYLEKATAFSAEIEKYETINETYSYSDSQKAQWYTNLWYRLNGESSEKNENSKFNYQVIDSNLLTSSSWLQDALAQGSVIIESASYIKAANQIPDLTQPDVVNLKGIKWETKVYTSCPDITTEDDKAAIAKAEAEYEQKTKEITAKEKKFDSKIRTLETEHEALTEEYNSVKSALDANISRSFKTFNS